jgi:hypothetical protein
VLEDDGRVAYAYLLKDRKIVADVWLYNVGESPESTNWRDKSAMPFLNPRGFCSDGKLPRLDSATNIDCSWFVDGVEVRVDGRLVARLVAGVHPGWSYLARLAGPLAKPLGGIE